MAKLKLTPKQRDKLMNSPVHYAVTINYIDKENIFEVECEYSEMAAIKKVVDD